MNSSFVFWAIILLLIACWIQHKAHKARVIQLRCLCSRDGCYILNPVFPIQAVSSRIHHSNSTNIF